MKQISTLSCYFQHTFFKSKVLWSDPSILDEAAHEYLLIIIHFDAPFSPSLLSLHSMPIPFPNGSPELLNFSVSLSISIWTGCTAVQINANDNPEYSITEKQESSL